VTTSSCKVPVHFCRIFTILVLLKRFSDKVSNIKFHQNPSSGSRVVPCGRTDRRIGTTKLTVAFRNFAKVPKTCSMEKSFFLFHLCGITFGKVSFPSSDDRYNHAICHEYGIRPSWQMYLKTLRNDTTCCIFKSHFTMQTARHFWLP
jgi:hypothetical protein